MQTKTAVTRTTKVPPSSPSVVNLLSEYLAKRDEIFRRRLRQADATGTLMKALAVPKERFYLDREDLPWAKGWHARLCQLAKAGDALSPYTKTIEENLIARIQKLEPSYSKAAAERTAATLRRPIPSRTPPAATQGPVGSRKPIPRKDPPKKPTPSPHDYFTGLAPKLPKGQQLTPKQILHIGKTMVRSGAMVLAEKFRCTPTPRGVDAIEEMLAAEVTRSPIAIGDDTAFDAAMKAVAGRIARRELT